MQKWNASLCTAGEEPKHFDRKGRHSVLQRTKKGILALGIAVFAFSSVPSLSALAAPSEQDDILVFSEDGGMVSQEEQTVEIVVEDNLKGDSRAKGQQVVDYASQFIGRPYRYGGFRLFSRRIRAFRDFPSAFFRSNSFRWYECRLFGKCASR